MRRSLCLVLAACALTGCAPKPAVDAAVRADRLTGGVRMITVQTPKGAFKVWTKRMGDNPRIKVLLLHGGPGATHEYFEALDSYFPAAGIEYYYYDQLGSARSDQPDAPDLWDIPRFVEEVEQVRQALGLDKENFFLLGHSWGGILALEYALKYQRHLKGLVISNMVASIPLYNRYAQNVLMPAMDPKVLTEILALEKSGRYDDPRYEELLMNHFKITVPTLAIGARYDTMEPAQMERIAKSVQRGRYLYCPTGSHLALYDDQTTYTQGLIRFLQDVDAGRL